MIRKLVRYLLAKLGVEFFKSNYDLAGYDAIIAFLKKKRVSKVKGDVLEIGAFMGGGTRKLARWADKCGKKVIVVDVFQPDADHTATSNGRVMAHLYTQTLGGKDLWQIFVQNTRDLRNLVVIRRDSKAVKIEQLLCFVFIDGNHDYSYVWNDFRLAWDNLSVGGWVGFHDYGHDLPSVTRAIDEIIACYRAKIANIERIESRWMIFLQKGVHNESGTS